MPLYNPSTVTDATLSISDITTNNASTSAHGFLKKLDNSATNFMNGQGNWAAPGISAAGLNNGTSFPGSPSTNDLFFRTDHGIIFFYNGTNWLSAQLLSAEFGLRDSVLNGQADTNSTGTYGRATVPYADTFDIYLERWETTTFVGATNNGSNYWTITLRWSTPAVSVTDLDSFNTSADTQANYVYHSEAQGAILTNTAVTFLLAAGDTGTVGSLIINGSRIFYRLVGS